MRLGLTLLAALALVGCGFAEDAQGGDTDDFIDMDTPPGNCSATDTGSMPCPDPGASTGIPEGEACRESTDCTSGNHCIAPFVDGEVGEFVCTFPCIGMMDEAAWCLDASACCDPAAVCSARGLCVEGALDESGTGADSGNGTASDDTAGSGTGTASTGGSESSGSDTGASTGSTGAMEQ